MPETPHQVVADLVRQAASKPEVSSIEAPGQYLIVSTARSMTLTLAPPHLHTGERINIQGQSFEDAIPPVQGEPGAIVMIQETPGIAIANLRGIERLSLVSDGTHWRRTEEPPTPSRDEPFSMTFWGRTLQQQQATQQIQADEDARILAELDRISRTSPERESLVAPVGREWGMTQRAPGHYGWHIERPAQPRDPLVAEGRPPGPRYIEPSYVMQPADRVRLPEFEIASNPTVRLDDIRNRRFELVDRIRDGSVTEFSMGTRVPYRMDPPPPQEVVHTNAPTIWQRLLGDDPV